MLPHYQNEENNGTILTTSMIPHYQTTTFNNINEIMCKVHVRLTTSMIPHYQNDENNVPGKSKFNNINDTPLPKRRK